MHGIGPAGFRGGDVPLTAFAQVEDLAGIGIVVPQTDLIDARGDQTFKVTVTIDVDVLEGSRAGLGKIIENGWVVPRCKSPQVGTRAWC